MKKVFLTILICLTTFFIMAEENTEESRPNYIGGAAGVSTGYGLSYRYWPGNIGTQIVFTPIINEYGSSFNLGTGLFKTLHEGKATRLFLFLAGNGTYREGIDYIYADEDPFELIEEKKITNFDWAVGFGPGLEIYFFKNIVLDIMFGYRVGQGEAVYNGLGFTAEVGLYYRF